MKSEVLNLLLVFISGLGLGTTFFYGLWWTVKRIKTSKAPALWILGSALSRTSITLAGFYYVFSFSSEGQLARLLLCLLGFLVARFTITKIIRAQPKSILLDIEVNRAP